MKNTKRFLSFVIAIVLVSTLFLNCSFLVFAEKTETSYGDWGAWSDWSPTYVASSDTREVQTATIYGYYYFQCPNCGKRWHGWGFNCFKWDDGCGTYIPEYSWHEMWSNVSWNDANCQDFAGTGKYVTYYWGERWFRWNDNGTPRTGYRYRDRSKTTNHFYEVNYNLNGGNGSVSSQLKQKDVALKLRTVKPSRSSISISFDANGGSVSTASKSLKYSFLNWNTAKNGNGTKYNSGDTYTVNEDVTLFAQWKSPEAGDLPIPTRNDSTFEGWYTTATGGTKITSSSTITKSQTLYAHWTAIPKKNYTITYDANGGSGAPVSQTKVEDQVLTLSSIKPIKSYTITYNANGGSVSSSSKSVNCTFTNWNTNQNGTGTTYNPGGSYTANADAMLFAQWTNPTAGTLATPTRNGYTFEGWYMSASGGTRITDASTITGNTTVYAHWEQVITYSVSYNANGGIGTPSKQTKTHNIALTLSSTVPTKSYTLSFNAAGGQVTPASKNLSCTFKNWTTGQNGGGVAFVPGGSYTANANVTLYAQWSNPTVGTLPTPTRNGYVFQGWFTSTSGVTQITSELTINGNTTLYAHWKSNQNEYNIGDETYSFANFRDSDSLGHCFGMSITSAGYFKQWIDIGRIGGNSDTSLYSFSDTSIVRKPICYYQNKQGSYRDRSMVAGGSTYKGKPSDIYTDWKEVVNYVKDHSYDNTGLLQIGFRKGSFGHAINFLRYENENGQDRIYAYDNNFPNKETFFYKDSDGNVYQAPVQSFTGSIDCICLRDINIYFGIVEDFDTSHVLYVSKDTASVQGYTFSYMESNSDDVEYVMYEIPADVSSVMIIPNVDNADFIYMDTGYSFGTITDDTYGVLTFASMDEYGAETPSSFKIYDGKKTYSLGDVDKNGKIEAADARLALRAAVGLEKYEQGSAMYLAADADGNRKIDAADARLILRKAVGFSDKEFIG